MTLSVNKTLDFYVEKLSANDIKERRLPIGTEVQVHAISDLHCDRSSNVKWWKQIVQNHIDKSAKIFHETNKKVHHILIIPGDISHQLKVIEDTLIEAKRGYDDVFFIPGNHEMWCTSTSKYSSSLEKCVDIVDLCNTLDVSCFPVYYPDYDILVAPMWSWYHASWDTTENTSKPTPGYFEDNWVDFHLCKWPSSIDSKSEITSLTSKSSKLALYFSSLNDPWLERYSNGLVKNIQ